MKIEAMCPMETDRWGRELATHGSLFSRWPVTTMT